MAPNKFLTPARIASYQRRHIPNEYRAEGDVAYIQLTNKAGTLRCETRVDLDLLPQILDYAHWRPQRAKSGAIYAMGHRRCVSPETGGRMPVYLHRLVLELDGRGVEGLYSDHIKGDTLDNRREMLRPATSSVNVRNNYRDRRIAELEAEIALLKDDAYRQ